MSQTVWGRVASAVKKAALIGLGVTELAGVAGMVVVSVLVVGGFFLRGLFTLAGMLPAEGPQDFLIATARSLVPLAGSVGVAALLTIMLVLAAPRIMQRVSTTPPEDAVPSIDLRLQTGAYDDWPEPNGSGGGPARGETWEELHEECEPTSATLASGDDPPTDASEESPTARSAPPVAIGEGAAVSHANSEQDADHGVRATAVVTDAPTLPADRDRATIKVENGNAHNVGVGVAVVARGDWIGLHHLRLEHGEEREVSIPVQSVDGDTLYEARVTSVSSLWWVDHNSPSPASETETSSVEGFEVGSCE